MGIKVYKGFKMQATTFQEAMAIVKAFQPWVLQQAEAVMDTFMENAEHAKKDPTANPYLFWIELRQNLLREKQLKVPSLDTDFSVLLIPSKDYLLGVVYTEHTDWYEAWCQHPGITEYAYWDNGDKLDSISEEEWELRAKDWDVLSHDPMCVQWF